MKHISLLFFLFLGIYMISSAHPNKRKHRPPAWLDVYVNDSLSISSFSVNKGNITHVFDKDKGIGRTLDDFVFILHKYSYRVYVPKLHEAFIVRSSKPGVTVSEHFIWFLTRMRQL